MNSSFYHIQVNIDFKHAHFYKELFTLLGWSSIFEMDDLAGYKSEKTGDIWFAGAPKKGVNDYDKSGVNHISIRVEKEADVEEVVHFLETKKVPPLFETPRHRPEFSSEGQTYYQVMFATEDNILFEIVYIGTKSK